MTNNKAPYIRYTEGPRVFYDVLCSKGTYYYTVEMLGATALSCECRGNAEFKRRCKHMIASEKAESKYQKNSAEIPNEEDEVRGDLNGERAFSMLRK